MVDRVSSGGLPIGPPTTPRDATGAPLRPRSEAWRRIMAGEPPERVSPSWPAFGRLVEVGGVGFREVTFVAEAAGSGGTVDAAGTADAVGTAGPVAIVVDGITESHRADLVGAMLDEVPGGRLRVIDYLLPDELVVSYGFVSAPWVDRAAGASWEGWFRLQDALVPDARNPRRLPTQFGRTASVLVGPAGVVHPAWAEAEDSEGELARIPARVAVPARVSAGVEVPLAGEFAGRSVVVLPWGSPGETVLLFDGEEWERVGIRSALARLSLSAGAPGDDRIAGAAESAGGAVVLIPSGTVEERWAVLPHPERAGALAAAALDALEGHRGGRPDPARTIVAGQSFGGLASAAVVALRPGLAATAIVQSGSFEFAADLPPEAWGSRPGDLVTTLAALGGTDALRGRRFHVQSGTEEHGATAVSTAFATTAAAAGATVTIRVVAGGHDYAWWRTALFDALESPKLLDPR